MLIDTTPRPRRTSSLVAAGLALTLPLLGACGIVPSETAEKKATDGATGKESGLLADWVPDDATDVVVKQRTTGAERLLVATYDGELPEDCAPIGEQGAPSRDELVAAYASDERTRRLTVDEMATVRTLEADWWPEGQEDRTTVLCGRWWVSHEDGTLFGFTPDLATALGGVPRRG